MLDPQFNDYLIRRLSAGELIAVEAVCPASTPKHYLLLKSSFSESILR
jgi:hypothetical protein